MITPTNPWPSLIYKSHYDGNLTEMVEVSSAICKSIVENHSLEAGGKSTWDRNISILDLPEFSHLKQWLIDVHSEAWLAWGFNDHRRHLHKSWVNWHPPGATTLEHDHGAVHLVIVVYLQQPENGGNIQFKDPLQYHWASYPSPDTDNWKTITVSTGDILFFPGFLRHRTEPNTSTEDRFVLTANITAQYAL